MIVVTTQEELRSYVRKWHKEGLSVGLVPTMGYLHEGHASLVDRAVASCDRVVASVFVNPTQFGPGEDLQAYPRDFEHDCELLEAHGCDLVFHPEVSEMYPVGGTATFVELLNDMPKQLCGVTRPIHFRGVCTVVSKLFNLVNPDKAFFGQKDAQQLSIIRRMVSDLSYGVEIVGCPIVRDEDGLAKSSRNTYLSAEERQEALVLSRAVRLGEKMYKDGERSAFKVVEAMKAEISKSSLACIDYVSAVNLDSLEAIETLEGPVLVAMAVYIGKTRLIDNFIVGAQIMFVDMLKGKIHRATVVQAELDYVGSITIDSALLEQAGIFEYEKVQIVDVNNGSRFETYAIAGERDSGMICLNGAAARCVSVGDKVIIMSYAKMSLDEVKTHKPKVVFVDDNNHAVRITTYEKHGLLKDM